MRQRCVIRRRFAGACGSRGGVSGYVPSLELLLYVATEAEEGRSDLIGQRQIPFGLGAQRRQMPYDQLPIRVHRSAYREFSRIRHWRWKISKKRLGREYLGRAWRRSGLRIVASGARVFRWPNLVPAIAIGQPQAVDLYRGGRVRRNAWGISRDAATGWEMRRTCQAAQCGPARDLSNREVGGGAVSGAEMNLLRE